MSASELEGLIVQNTSPLLGGATKASLISILQTAEIETILQIRSIPVLPTTNPLTVQDQAGNKRMEMLAEAIMSFLNSMQASMASATADAVNTYLQAHSTATMIPGSLQSPQGPVVATGPISSIQY